MMGHIQHLSFENLVKMDHFQKEPPLNLKGTTGGKGIGNPGQTECPLWVNSGHVQRKTSCPLYPRKRTYAAHKPMSTKCQKRTCASHSSPGRCGQGKLVTR